MDDIIGQVAAGTGVEKDRVRRAVTIIVAFLEREGPPDKVKALLDMIPGARELATEAPAVGAGLMGVFGSLTKAGLGMGEIPGVAREFVRAAEARVGKTRVDDVIGGIPGLSQFV